MKDGGHAFPCMTGPNSAEVGMTLRDYFAGQVLGASMAATENPSFVNDKNIALSFAREAYLLADAMLEEREKEEKV